jgi:hypothetical protein
VEVGGRRRGQKRQRWRWKVEGGKRWEVGRGKRGWKRWREMAVGEGRRGGGESRCNESRRQGGRDECQAQERHKGVMEGAQGYTRESEQSRRCAWRWERGRGGCVDNATSISK